MKTIACLLASTLFCASAGLSIGPPPTGELLLGYFPPIGVTLTSGDAPLRLETEFFVPYRWRDPNSSRYDWHAQRSDDRMPFSMKEPFREWAREESRLLFFPNRVH